MRVRLTKLFGVLILSATALWGYQVILEADALCGQSVELCIDNGCCPIPPCQQYCHFHVDHCDCGTPG